VANLSTIIIVAAVVLITFHLISLFKTGNMMENGNLVVVFHFSILQPYY